MQELNPPLLKQPVVPSAGTTIGKDETTEQVQAAAGTTDGAEVIRGEEDVTVVVVARFNRTEYVNKDCFRFILMYNS